MLTQVFCFDAYWTFYWIFEGGIPSHYVFLKREIWCYDGTNKKVVVELCKFNTMH